MKALGRHMLALYFTFSSSCYQETTYTQTASGLIYMPARYRQPSDRKCCPCCLARRAVGPYYAYPIIDIPPRTAHLLTEDQQG